MARNPCDIRLLLVAAAVAFIYIQVRLFSTQSSNSHDAGRLAEAEKCESQLHAMIDQVSAQQDKIAALQEMKVRQDEERVHLKMLIQDLEKRSLQTLINKNVVPVAAVVIMDYLQRTVESILKYQKAVASKFPLFISQDGTNGEVKKKALSYNQITFMQEASNGVIQIKDMEPKVFMALLSFVYTDSFPDMYEDNIKLSELCKDTGQGHEDEMSEAVGQGQGGEAAEDEMGLLQWLQGLFVAADRYDLQRLKFICVKQLSQRIGVTSVASTLALAEQHQCRGLKEACLKFIQVQSPPCLQTLMASNGWGHIVTTYPSVLSELIAMLASNQRK